MQFDKIRWDGSRVELEYQEELAGGGQRDVQDHGKDPAPAFKGAIQAFTSYVLWVHSWPAELGDRLEIRGVTIKRPDDAPRGIVVTALLKCPHARNSTSTINTPYVSEPPEGYNGEMTGFLSIAVRELIDALEERATEYQNGERGEQTSLALGESENTKSFNERSAAAETKTTRKAKKAAAVPDAPAIADGEEDLTDDRVRQLLMMCERDVPVELIGKWSASERTAAIAWARQEQKRMAGGLKGRERVPEEPTVIKASATMPLGLSKAPAVATSRTVQ